MSCDRYREAIADAAAGAEAAPGLGAHLRRCGACRTELEAQREALAVADAELSSLLASEAPLDLSARIRRAVAADENPGWWPPRAWPALAAAAVLVIALAAAVLWRAAPRPPAPETAPQARLAPTPSEPGSRADQPAPFEEPRRQTTKATLAQGAAGARTPAEPPPAPERPPGPEPPPALSAGPRAPEVLVPAGREEALLRFVAELQSRTVTPDSLLVAERSAPLNEPRPLHQVEIEMLTLGASARSGL